MNFATMEFTADASWFDNDARALTERSGYHAEVIILAPFILLALGAFLRYSTSSLHLPYTMQLLVVGTGLGLLLRQNNWNNAMQHSLETLGDMDPHLMLHIFLPPLIFESAASLEWNLFARAKWSIFALAGPGLLLASAMTGCVIHMILNGSERFRNDLIESNCPSGAWSPHAALMLGVIMSATDPVAVVALLKDLGCKASLSTEIEGESLLNDGTALVVFTILVKIVEGDNSDGLGDYLWTFIKMSIGGSLFGISFSVVITQWLRRIFNDAQAEITITLSAAYLCFFIAEYWLGISGIMAVVCLGLHFGNSGRTSVSPEVAHFLEEFWELLAFIGNTLIFIIAGTIIGFKLPSVQVEDFVQLIVMYLVCTLIRTIVVGFVYIVFRTLGFNIEKKDQIVTIWAGLRGAVGLSLAMMVHANSKICEPIRDIVMFHTGGIVFLTVIINSTTMPKLVSTLGLNSITPPKQRIFDQAMDTLISAGFKQESNLRADHIFDSTLWDQARKYYFHLDRGTAYLESAPGAYLDEREARKRVLMITKKSYWRQFQEGLLSEHSVKYLVHHTDIAIDNDCSLDEWKTYIKLVRLSSATNNKAEDLTESEREKLKLLNFLNSLPVILLILVLVFASCILAFTLDSRSWLYRIIENVTTFVFFVELCTRLYCLRGWHAFAVDPYIAIDMMAVILDIFLLSTSDLLGVFSEYSKSIRVVRFLRLVRFIRLVRVANNLKRAKIAATDDPTSIWEKTGSWGGRFLKRIQFSQMKHGYEIATGFKVARGEVAIHIQTSGTHMSAVRDSVENDLKAVRSALLDVQRLYSEIAASITTAVAARTVLNKQRHSIQDLYHDGLLDSNEYKKIKGSIEFKMKTLTTHPPIVEMPKKKDILGQISWLECLNAETLSEITSCFEDRVFQRGDILVKQNELSDCVHVLARGTVAVSYTNESGEVIEIDELGMGSVFGEIAWALKCRRGASIIATSPGLLFTIDGSLLKDSADSNEELGNRIWETCGRRLSENLLAIQGRNSRQDVRNAVHEMKLFAIIDPTVTKRCFHSSGYVIILCGTAFVRNSPNEKSEVVESPQILHTTNTNDIVYQVEFTADAKFMCHPLTITDNEGKLVDNTVSMRRINVSLLNLELKRSSTFSPRSSLTNTIHLKETVLTNMNDVRRCPSATYDSAHLNRRKTTDFKETKLIKNNEFEEERGNSTEKETVRQKLDLV